MKYKMTRLRIKTKLLLLSLGITAFCALSFFVIANYTLYRGGEYILEQSLNLGRESAEKSRTTLEDQTRLNLTQLVGIQAQTGNNFFNSVHMEVNTMSKFCKLLWETDGQSLGQYATDKNERELSHIYRLAPGVDKKVVQGEFMRLRTMGNVFKPYLFDNANLDSLFLGTQTGINILWPDTGGRANKPYDPRIRPWYKNTVARDGIGWTEIFKGASTSKLMIACSGPVRTREGELKGVIGITVTLDEMLKVISSQVKEVGYAFLLDKGGNVIAFPALGQEERIKDYGLGNLLETKNEELSNIVKKMVAGQNGFSRIRLNSGEKFIGFAPIKETGWSMAVVISAKTALKLADETKKYIMDYTLSKKERIISVIVDIQKYLMAFFIGVLLITILVAVKMSDKISKPILDLTQGVKKVGKGDLDLNFEIKTGDEIETLAEAFNTMTNDLKLYIKNLKETTAEKEKIQSELQVATKIQASMLPRIFPAFPERDEFDIFASMIPAREVGGDLFDFFFISENKFCFLIGDVSGKGVPASLFMIIAKTLIKNEALRGIPPEEIFTNVNNALCENNDESMFVTAFICIIDLETGRLDFANAGHNPPLQKIAFKGGTYDFMTPATGFVLGGMPDFSYVKESFVMAPGDIIFLYTDGVNEAMNPDYNEYTDLRLKALLSKEDTDDVNEIVELVNQDVKHFANDAEQSDDITILTFKYNGLKE